MTSLLLLPERHPGRIIAGIGLLFACAYGLSLVLLPKPDGRLLIGDALHHYVQLRSAVFDRDLQFQNEYMRMYGVQHVEPETRWIFVDLTATGHVRNVMPVGPALLWAPAFLLVTAGVWIANLAGASYPLDGYGRAFQATAGFSGVAAAAAGVWLTYLTCAALFERRWAVWSTVTLWLSSSAVYYSVISPTYSHAASLLATSAFWYAFVVTRNRPALRRYALLGALAGSAALMRWQDAMLMVVIAIDLMVRLRSGARLRDVLAWGALGAAAAAVVFVPQMVVWHTLYGRALAIPQGGGFMRWTRPALVAVLFSTWRGLLTWTPIVAAALAGMLPLARRERVIAACAIVFFAMSWYVNAAVADWWAGEAFGSRRFISCFPVFALGLTALLQAWSPSPRALATISGAITAHTFLLLVQYQTFMKGLRHVAPYPQGAYELWLARFRVPFDLIAWWWRS
jgi:hypothetical protein